MGSGREAVRLGYRPALDGVRAVAIIAVVSFHAYGRPSGGSIGVDLFFVLSGFLITTLLLEERETTGTISLRGFYSRRMRRLFPALAVMLAGFLIIGSVKSELGWATRSVLYGGFYTANIVRAFGGQLLDTKNPVGALWSLAMEEQFYLVWPALLIFLIRRGFSYIRLRQIVGVATILLLAEGLLLWLFGYGLYRVGSAPDTRAPELLAGAALAIGLRAPVAATTDLALIGLAGFTGLSSIGLSYGPSFAPVTGASLCLIAGVVLHPDTRTARLISTRPFVFFGKISYSLYLWHLVIFWAFDWGMRPLAIAVSVFVAWLSYRYVEQPFRRRHARAAEAQPSAVPAPSTAG